MDQNETSSHLLVLVADSSDLFVAQGDCLDDQQAFTSRKHKFGVTVYWMLVALSAAVIITIQPVFAAGDFWDAFSTIMKDIYGKLLGVSTIIAVTAATVALLIRMISRNQRAVDEASSWLKRILITWIILNTLGFIIAYLQPLISGGQYSA